MSQHPSLRHSSFSVTDTVVVSKILGGSAAKLAPGGVTPSVQETASSIYHVIEGSGYSTIGENKYHWVQGDTFCIPAWFKYQHFADPGDSPVYLYRFDDKPMLKSLGFYRTTDMDIESMVFQ